MILNIPRDFESYHLYRTFQLLLNGDAPRASYAFMRLWAELGYQVEMNGRVGLFLSTERPSFITSLKCAEPEMVFQQLVASSILVHDGTDYFCRWFGMVNGHLEREVSRFKDRRAMLNRLDKKWERAGRVNLIQSQIDPECWVRENGVDKMTPAEMNQCLVLIRILDDILDQKNRHPQHYTAGLLQAAYAILHEYSETKIKVVLQRLFMVAAVTPELPRNTSEALRRWTDMIALIFPDEGFLKWAKENEEAIQTTSSERYLSKKAEIREVIHDHFEKKRKKAAAAAQAEEQSAPEPEEPETTEDLDETQETNVG